MPENFPEIRLKKGKERAMQNRHPWIFSGALAAEPEGVESGSIVAIRDASGGMVGYGFFAPKSQISCKVFEFIHRELTLDDEYWHNKIARAIALRRATVLSSETNACRLVFSEADGLPGLIVDQYGDVIVVQILTRGMERLTDVLIAGLQACGYTNLYLRSKSNTERFEGTLNHESRWIGTRPNAPVCIREHGMQLEVDVEQGQKTGLFLDQRENRLLLRHYSHNKTVLNAFAYTGGFSVAALMGGARSVDSVDISTDALATCDRNIALNGFGAAAHHSLRSDCFDYLRACEQTYDLIVLDPPAFAKNAKATQAAARGYKDLNWVALKKIQPGGILFTFSCSRTIDRELFRKIVFSAAADSGRAVKILHQLSQPCDHPISIYHPEGEYLKGLVLQVE